MAWLPRAAEELARGLDVLQLDADKPAGRLSTLGWGQFSSITRSKHDDEPNDSAPPEWMAHVAEMTPSCSHFSGSRISQRPHVLNGLFRSSSSAMRRTAPAAQPPLESCEVEQIHRRHACQRHWQAGLQGTPRISVIPVADALALLLPGLPLWAGALRGRRTH